MKKKSQLILVLTLLFSSIGFSQNFFPVDRKDFNTGIAANNSINLQCISNPNRNGCNYAVISPSSGTGNDTNRIKQVINNATPGQTIVFKSGTYRFREIAVKSNIRIKMQKNVIFIPFTGGIDTTKKGITMFNLGSSGNGNVSVQNVNISAITNNSKDRFTFDFTALNYKAKGVVAFSVGRATNFRLANFNVKDNFTRLQCISLAPQGPRELKTYAGQRGLRFTKLTGIPTNGIIEHANVDKAAFGYGMVQAQAGDNIYFNKLSGTGGATLRLESGAFAIAHAIPSQKKKIFFRKIYGENISSTNGHTAIMVSPHSVQHKDVHFKNIIARSSAVGIRISRGFLTPDEIADPAVNVKGKFTQVTFEGYANIFSGNNAQLKKNQHINLVSCSTRSLFNPPLTGTGKNQTGDNESFRGPSVAAITYFSSPPKGVKSGTNGYYNAKFNFDATSVNRLKNRRNSFNNPNPTASGRLNSFDDAKNNCGSITKNLKEIDNSITFVKDSNGSINVDLLNDNAQVNIYNVSGALVKSLNSVKNSKNIHISDLNSGVYIIEVITNGQSIVKKVSIN